ncbi:MAG TPA: anti-sigma factor, partial [Cytophagales bacterium]|nr:anti-sigma factor [Cytophagales bacterium]
GAVAIAASVTLLVVGYFAFQGSGPTQYQTAYGETTKFTLPDGSTVTLNTSSMASFEEDTWKENRQIQLEGEAYFEVARGARFTVSLDENTQVEVLGTRFLVRQRENYLTVACYEGLVGVNSADGQDSLRAGSILRYDGDSLAIAEVEVLRPEWIINPGATSFKDAPLGEVLHALEAQYGVKVLAITGVDVSRPYSGSFVNSDIKLALRMVTEPLSLSYEEISDGNYRVY